MTLATPPYALQGGSHGAQLFREAASSLIAPAGGIVQSGDLAVTQQSSPNMTIAVGAGRIWVPGTSLATVNPGGGAYYPQGLYYTENDAAVTLAISAANVTNPRIDMVICQIQDTAYGAGTNLAQLAVVTGTATAGATLANLSGVGALPASSLVLANVLVPANASTIVTADIANVAGTIGQPYISGYNSTAASLTNGVWTLVPVDTLIASGHGPILSADQIVVESPGIYLVTGAIGLETVAPTGGLIAGIYHNGSLVKRGDIIPYSTAGSGSVPVSATVGGLVRCPAATDTIALYGFNTYTSTITSLVDGTATYLDAAKVSTV
jgi:hypothetical protein